MSKIMDGMTKILDMIPGVIDKYAPDQKKAKLRKIRQIRLLRAKKNRHRI